MRNESWVLWKSWVLVRYAPPRVVVGLLLPLYLAGCSGVGKNPEATPTAAPAVTEVEAATPPAVARSLAPTLDRTPRDWDRCPAIADIAPAGDLLAVGDAHGDWEKLRDLLVGAEVIERPAPERPDEAIWKAEDATLVLVGDFSGKYDRSLDVIALVRSLQQQAKVVGGQVIATLGNHEAEFLAPRLVDGKLVWEDKTEEFRQELVDHSLDPEEVWRVRGDERSRELGEFLHCLPAAAASDKWFFAHAGSTAGKTLAELRRTIEEGVDAEGYRTGVLLGKATGLLEARLKPKAPTKDVWWQELPEPQEESEDRLRGYAEALGVEHIVMGHQASKYKFNRDIERKKGRVFQLFDGTLYLTDVGMSRGQKGGLSAGALLHVERGGGDQSVSVICPDGLRRPLPPEGESTGLRCELP